ncbi:MAG: hypothetical protein IKA61_05930, partial [Clostridia bacterium]|nr:hypothetical protein [Clostridia bacterium]
IPAPQHSYGDWVKDNEKHWKVCSCGLKSSENTHQYDDNSDMICNDCGYDRTVQHTHGNGTKQDGQGATCTVNGWKDYYKCSCGRIYEDVACTNEITSFEEWKVGAGKIAAGHTFGDWHTEIPATTEKEGTKAHKDCTVCGKHFDENGNEITELAIPKLEDSSTPNSSVNGGSSDSGKKSGCGSAIGGIGVGMFALASAATFVFFKKRKEN